MEEGRIVRRRGDAVAMIEHGTVGVVTRSRGPGRIFVHLRGPYRPQHIPNEIISTAERMRDNCYIILRGYSVALSRIVRTFEMIPQDGHKAARPVRTVSGEAIRLNAFE